MALFTDEFLEKLPSDRLEALQAVCEIFMSGIGIAHVSTAMERMEELLEGYAVLKALLVDSGLNIQLPDVNMAQAAARNSEVFTLITGQFKNVQSLLAQMDLESKYKNMQTRALRAIGKSFGYEFSEGDVARIQVLINELRDEISGSTFLGDDHRVRLLSRLEKLQTELHTKVTSLDRFWGLFVEASVALGKFGDNAKPMFDRVREITEIVWGTQARAEGLPSTAAPPALPSPRHFERDLAAPPRSSSGNA